MNLKQILVLVLCLSIPLAGQAQKRTKKSTTKTRKTNIVPEYTGPSAQTLMQEYRFEEAIARLETEIAEARKKSLNTMALEAQLQRAHLGQSMFEATERVVFIDSMSMSRQNFLEALRLSRNTGKIMLSALIPSEMLQCFSGKLGNTIYINELGNRTFFSKSDSTGQMRLHTAYRHGDTWTQPEPLTGISTDAESGDADYPFVLADGVTLYYAAQGDESIGGYDIFVTRYNSDTRRFVKPENIGMPFNSPYNDYLYIIDETTGIGWFVSDRYQPADSVCVYSFIPNESREVYDIDESTASDVRQAALLLPFSRSRGNAEVVAEAHQRLEALKNEVNESTSALLRFVINDRVVYTSLSQFRDSSARLIASQLIETKQKLQTNESTLHNLRKQYHAKPSPQLSQSILTLESENEKLHRSVATLEKNMRQAELKALAQ